MLPSLTQPILSAAPGAAMTAEPLLSGVAPGVKRAARTSDAIGTVRSIADSLAGYAAQGGVPAAPTRRGAPARSARATAAGAGYAQSASAATSSSKSATTSSKTSTSAKSGPLAFLDDSKLSVEDKLMRLLAYLNDKWDKDIDKKMKEIGAGAGATSSAASAGSASASKPKEKSGILGSIVKAAKEFFPGVGIAAEALANPAVRALATKVGGPVLAAAATALGFPELAPALLKYGPQVVDLASGAASAFVDAGGAAAPASGGATASAAASDGAATSDRKVQQRLMEIQRIIDQQKEMFSLVSNMLRSTHETRMAVIQNVR